jgi:hypothetical protein
MLYTGCTRNNILYKYLISLTQLHWPGELGRFSETKLAELLTVTGRQRGKP